jgi:uncharacterized protein
MTDREKAELVEYRWKSAKETLQEVKPLMNIKLWNTCVNRLYYACFYAVSALLAQNDILTKTHSGSLKMFSLHFLKSGIINEDTGVFYSKIFSMRQNADYEDFFDYEQEDVEALITPANELINEIEKILFLGS